ncbi:MAG: 1-acyl-sn-glycerol-3-phosphate acyltransferase [Clostridiales bacterium]|nr:1-acyl-sn-glycerol-3-phosphate acyltransferase [Clostridiales bacterium]
MSQPTERFNMHEPPRRQKWYLRPLTWLLSYPEVWLRGTRIKRINTSGLKPPYILLSNHNAFLDFKVAVAAMFPHRSNFIVAIDGFIGRENLLRNVGCICKRKFTNDIVMIKHLQKVIKNGDILVIYPEARYSLCGTTAVLPDSIGKLCKFLKVPVVSLIIHGHHINSPFWSPKKRGVRPTEATLTQLYTAEELAGISAEEINDKIRETFVYDDFAWQRENKIKNTYHKRAEGLHKVLYQCSHCLTEYKMSSGGTQLRCDACGKTWTLGIYGELSADSGETEFSHIPDWYEWERRQVRAEVQSGTYSFSGPVTVDSLPNAERFVRLGEGYMTHNMNGFYVCGKTENGEAFEMTKTVPSLYSCHIEYDYLGKRGDCVDLNTLTDTWYIYPSGGAFSVTKMALATEELYQAYVNVAGRKALAPAAP